MSSPVGHTANASKSDRALVSIAVCIPSKNRLGDILRCIRSIGRQTLRPNEIIVIDQSDARYELPPNDLIRHIYDPSISGLTAARNIAWSAATSDAILFIDDDVELCATCLEELARAFERYPDAAAFQCGMEVKPTNKLSWLGILHAKLFQRGFFNSSRIRRGGVTELRRLAGCAMAFRRSLYEHERFDELLVGYCIGEDWEISKRVRSYGRLLLVPGPLLVHHRSPLNRHQMEQLQRDRWDNFLYFYDKLGANKSFMNRVWRVWWMFGESLRWARYGLGFPLLGIKSKRTRSGSFSLRKGVVK